MDEYFKEGEAKSRELDHAPSESRAKGVPPPPKVGSVSNPTAEEPTSVEPE